MQANGNGYQMLLPDLQQIVSAQQPADVSSSPMPLPGVSPMLQQAAALQQQQQQQQQQQLAVAAAAAGVPAGIPPGMLSFTLQQQLAAAQAALGNQSMGLQGLHGSGLPLPPTFAHPNDMLLSQLMSTQHPMAPGHSDVSHLTLNLEQLKQPPKAAEPTTRSIQRSRSETGASSAYASRHQAAEQRRRTRINERLDRLRKIVPHAERANTATFLEEVINYIGKLKAEIATLKGEPVEPLEPTVPLAADPTHTLTEALTTATNDPTTTVLSAPAGVRTAEAVGTSASPRAAAAAADVGAA